MNWHPLSAPSVDGGELTCSGDCSLHLVGRTHSESNAIYSSANAVGLAIGIGNVGLYLDDNNTNTYLTRDGGVTWREVRLHTYLIRSLKAHTSTRSEMQEASSSLHPMEWKPHGWWSRRIRDVRLRDWKYLPRLFTLPASSPNPQTWIRSSYYMLNTQTKSLQSTSMMIPRSPARLPPSIRSKPWNATMDVEPSTLVYRRRRIAMCSNTPRSVWDTDPVHASQVIGSAT
jgi:hypothetical protein